MIFISNIIDANAHAASMDEVRPSNVYFVAICLACSPERHALPSVSRLGPADRQRAGTAGSQQGRVSPALEHLERPLLPLSLVRLFRVPSSTPAPPRTEPHRP